MSTQGQRGGTGSGAACQHVVGDHTFRQRAFSYPKGNRVQTGGWTQLERLSGSLTAHSDRDHHRSHSAHPASPVVSAGAGSPTPSPTVQAPVSRGSQQGGGIGLRGLLSTPHPSCRHSQATAAGKCQGANWEGCEGDLAKDALLEAWGWGPLSGL